MLSIEKVQKVELVAEFKLDVHWSVRCSSKQNILFQYSFKLNVKFNEGCQHLKALNWMVQS